MTSGSLSCTATPTPETGRPARAPTANARPVQYPRVPAGSPAPNEPAGTGSTSRGRSSPGPSVAGTAPSDDSSQSATGEEPGA